MKRTINFLALLFLIPFTGYGQSSFRSTGTTELGGDFGFSAQSSNNGDKSLSTFSSDLFIGIMAAPGFEIGFRPGFTVRSSSGDTYKIYNLFLNPAYHFNTTTNVYPYLGLIVGYNSIGYNKDNYSGIGIGGEAGVKINLQGASMLLLKFEYLSQTYNKVAQYSGYGQSSSDEKINTTLFALGYRIFLEKKSIQKVK